MFFRHSIYFYVTLLAALSLRFRRQLGEWIDRRFFREAYNQEQILRALIEALKQLNDLPAIARLVSREIEAALHPARVYVFYREGEQHDLTLGYSSGGTTRPLRIPGHYALVRWAENSAHPLDSQAWQQQGLPPHEQSWLAELGAHLLVPITFSSGRLAGLLVLGAKKSEEPYGLNDRRLLQALADQIAVVVENIQLRQRVVQADQRERTVLARLAGERVNVLKECPSCGACYDGDVQLCAQDGQPLKVSLPVERTLDGKYRLEQLLGKGGMGAVYRATDLRLQRQVALKILTAGAFGEAAALRRFEREARAVAQLNHPHIVAVYDYGNVGGSAYLVMECLRGVTLRVELKRRGKLEPQTAAQWFEQILAGVQAAHAAGIVHRDLKPENVLAHV
ncbi:MAG: protein kinase [Acidobacteria bacterium]|nr:protein kinase [Acidobacteriota bacterium]